MARLARLDIEMAANSAKLVAEVERANRSIQGFSDGVGKAANFAKGIFAAVSVGAFAGFVKGAINAADEINDLNNRLGISTEALSQYKYVAQLSGVEFEQFTNGLKFLNKNVSEAAHGNQATAKTFSELGLSANKLSGLDLDKQFETIADRINDVKNAADRTRIAQDLFGKSGAVLLQITTEGADGIKSMREEADRLGLTITKTQALSADLANDQLTALRAKAQGFANVVAINVLPVMSQLLGSFLDSSDGSETLRKSAVYLAAGFKIFVTTGASVVDIVQAIGNAVGGLSAVIKLLSEDNLKGAAKVFSLTFHDIEGQVGQAVTRISSLSDFDKLLKAPEIKYSSFKPRKNYAIEEVEPDSKRVSRLNKTQDDAKKLAEELKKGSEEYTKSLMDQDNALLDFIDSMRTEDQVAQDVHSRRLELIQDNVDKTSALYQFLTDQENQRYVSELAALEKRFQDEQDMRRQHAEQVIEIESQKYGINAEFIASLEKASLTANEDKIAGDKAYREAAISGGRNLLAAAAQQNKKAFELNKVAASAEATVSGYEAVQNALATKAPWPLPQIFAGIAAANAELQINGIRKTTFGGGGSISSAASGGGSITSASNDATFNNQNNGVQNIEINLRGISDNAILTKNQLRSIMNQISDETKTTRFKIS